MRVLVVDDNFKQLLKDVRIHAEKNPFSMDDMLDVFNKIEKPAGDREGFSCFLPYYYKVVYSIEDLPAGRVRHLSVSVPSNGKLPSIEAVKLILKELGYMNELEACAVYIEAEIAVNVVEFIK